MPGLKFQQWDLLLKSWLHDPPDKALCIRGHESRSRPWLEAFGVDLQQGELHVSSREGDIAASASERLPMPTAGAEGERAVDWSKDERIVFHPLSGEPRRLNLSSDQKHLENELIARYENREFRQTPMARYLKAWRFLREDLESFEPDMAWMPADTRQPDHSIWAHMDLTAALQITQTGGHTQTAFLAFSLGPVQPFIEASRSLKDLLASSTILSWLTFHAMLPIIEKLGPSALVFPNLRGNRLMNQWIKSRAPSAFEQAFEERLVEEAGGAALPNRFLAVVDAGLNGVEGQLLVQACLDSARKAWWELAEYAHRQLKGKWDPLVSDWDALWKEQVESSFSFNAQLLPWREMNDQDLVELNGAQNFAKAWPNSDKARSLLDIIGADRYGWARKENSVGLWPARVEMTFRLLDAQKDHAQNYRLSAKTHEVPAKCSSLGTFEQLGPGQLSASAKFWEQACSALNNSSLLKLNERFSAPPLIKRFALQALSPLSQDLCLHKDETRFEDLEHIAYSNFENSGLKSKPNYYAAFMLDGDDMGRWLQGINAPLVRDCFHPKICDYFESKNRQLFSELGSAKRPLGPSLHASISEALGNFATVLAPHIVKKYHGALIYAGGDDLLAFFPLHTALLAANDLQKAFRGLLGGDNTSKHQGWFKLKDREYLCMGHKATVSAGLVVAHKKEDLRYVLQRARAAEMSAKQWGRNALSLGVLRRSGEHVDTDLDWELLPIAENLRQYFLSGASDRFTYALRRESAMYVNISCEDQKAELIRILKKGGPECGQIPGAYKSREELMTKSFDTFSESQQKRSSSSNNNNLELFCQFLQSVSFMTRGGES